MSAFHRSISRLLECEAVAKVMLQFLGSSASRPCDRFRGESSSLEVTQISPATKVALRANLEGETLAKYGTPLSSLKILSSPSISCGVASSPLSTLFLLLPWRPRHPGAFRRFLEAAVIRTRYKLSHPLPMQTERSARDAMSSASLAFVHGGVGSSTSSHRSLLLPPGRLVGVLLLLRSG